MRARSGRASSQAWTPELVAASLFAFVVLGLPDGMMGVAWPSVRETFGQPLAALGELLLALLAGYLCLTSIAGKFLRRWGTARLLIVSALAGTAGAALFAGSPSWPAVVVAALLLGVAGGGLDAALNTVVALDRESRLMNLLHGCYGVGAAIGPLLVTVVVAAASSWRPAYLVLLVAEAALVVTWVTLRHRLPSSLPEPDGPAPDTDSAVDATTDRRRRGRGMVGLSVGVFFFAAALEGTAAAWAASYLRGPGGLSATGSGVAVFVFASGLTLGRMVAAWVSPRVSPEPIARVAVAGSAVGAALLWAGLGPAAAVVGLAVLGFSLGPVFPALMLLTPTRLGSRTAVHAVGWQLAAAATGGVGVAALAGVVLQTAGLESYGPILMVLVVVLGGFVAAGEWMASRIASTATDDLEPAAALSSGG